jgi:hypothetical protein
MEWVDSYKFVGTEVSTNIVRRKPQPNAQSKTKRIRLCPKCKRYKKRTPGVKDLCPYLLDVYNEKVYCWCCDKCRNDCAEDI